MAVWGKVWGKTLPNNFSSAGILPLVTSPNQRLSSTDDMKWTYSGSKEIGVASSYQFNCIEDPKRSLQNLETVAFQQHPSKQGYSPDPSLCGKKGLGLRLGIIVLAENQQVSLESGGLWEAVPIKLYFLHCNCEGSEGWGL